MSLNQPKFYEICDFNIEDVDFLGSSLKYLSNEADIDIQRLEEIPKFFKSSEVNIISQIFYGFFHTEQFSRMYQRFMSEYIAKKFDYDFLFQQIPSIRIAFPNCRSVNFHNDCWYGHGDEIKNIWVPLTNVRGTQSLAFFDQNENDLALEKFYKEAPSLVEIQDYCEPRSHFAECDYGEFLVFPTKALHGTKTNQSKDIRVSFDFRVSLDGDIGRKNKKFFVPFSVEPQQNPPLLKSKNATALGYLNQYQIFDDFSISQTIQQESIISYSKKNNLDLITLETELIGFSRPINLEDLLFGSRKGEARDIVVFSEKILNLNKNSYSSLVNKAMANGYRFHCVNEGIMLAKLE